jgi:hypothetical protein
MRRMRSSTAAFPRGINVFHAASGLVLPISGSGFEDLPASEAEPARSGKDFAFLAFPMHLLNLQPQLPTAFLYFSYAFNSETLRVSTFHLVIGNLHSVQYTTRLRELAPCHCFARPTCELPSTIEPRTESGYARLLETYCRAESLVQEDSYYLYSSPLADDGLLQTSASHEKQAQDSMSCFPSRLKSAATTAPALHRPVPIIGAGHVANSDPAGYPAKLALGSAAAATAGRVLFPSLPTTEPLIDRSTPGAKKIRS